MGIEVLVVEDQAVNVLLLRVLLEASGFIVRHADTAEEALDAARQRPPDLILMDVVLPGMNGLEAVRILKTDRTTRGICVVGLSGNAMKEDAEQALAAGCDGYVTKPIDTRALPHYLRELLEAFRRGE
jgi:CheY-like chemotaxis protein